LKSTTVADAIINSRRNLSAPHCSGIKAEAEGGCGVVGLACNTPLEGKYLLQSLVQMRNRGNGKGGGIAALGLVPEQLGVTKKILEEDYILQVAYLDNSVRKQVEDEFIRPFFDLDHHSKVPSLEDYRSVQGLEVKPPEVCRYFVRVKPEILDDFARKNSLSSISKSELEDEFVYRNSYQLNLRYYSSLGEKKAFVVSHGKNLIVLKIVGYGDDVIRYHQLENFKAHVWIGHHRYPTKGRLWHPGGAHPFVGLHEALVHNGDFANYHSIVEYLAQRNIHPLFLTDTEVSVLLFDLLSRVYKYPLEYLIEALAPTTERDFQMLSEEKRRIYHLIQTSHIHGSPDGPWFFIVARNDIENNAWQLLGITDTSMLRPQVFALQEGPVKIGIIASERQAINAVLRGLKADSVIPSKFADVYWNARGGSHADGGAFLFNVRQGDRGTELECTDKFGQERSLPDQEWLPGARSSIPLNTTLVQLQRDSRTKDPEGFFDYIRPALRDAGFQYSAEILGELKRLATRSGESRHYAIQALSIMYDRIYDTGYKRRSSLLQLFDDTLTEIFDSIPLSDQDLYTRIDWKSRSRLKHPGSNSQILVADTLEFPVEGDESAARFLVEAYNEGWRNVVLYNLRGHRFIGNGLGPRTNGLKVDCYGDVGDYVGSGIDGCEIVVHGAAQDQAGQILTYGRLVVHGDVGQAFMYAAKGGHVYVLGNAAGRPLINAVGGPKVVINGTCLDYLAESFMAGDPYNGGGFVVVNGLMPSFDGRFVEQEYPYPGSNLFSLASGGAIFIRDPYRRVSSEQLNGGRLTEFTQKDWELILPYLVENEKLFGISIREHLLTVKGKLVDPSTVYRKIEPIQLHELT
jgi:glutamate synthase domain-containing protein 1/glutamate synthase domain-containing protein 3